MKVLGQCLHGPNMLSYVINLGSVPFTDTLFSAEMYNRI